MSKLFPYLEMRLWGFRRATVFSHLHFYPLKSNTILSFPIWSNGKGRCTSVPVARHADVIIINFPQNHKLKGRLEQEIQNEVEGDGIKSIKAVLKSTYGEDDIYAQSLYSNLGLDSKTLSFVSKIGQQNLSSHYDNGQRKSNTIQIQYDVLLSPNTNQLEMGSVCSEDNILFANMDAIPDILFTKDEIFESRKNDSFLCLLDTGCPTTVAGKDWMKNYILSLPKEIVKLLSVEKSERMFKFGGGEIRKSLGNIVVPAIIVYDHTIGIVIEVVDAEIPLLIGGLSLERREAVLDFGNKTLTLPNVNKKKFTIAINKEKSGHYSFRIKPVKEIPKVESEPVFACFDIEKICTESWEQNKATNLIDEVLYGEIKNQVKLGCIFVGQEVKGDVTQELSKKEVEKLHHYFGLWTCTSHKNQGSC